MIPFVIDLLLNLLKGNLPFFSSRNLQLYSGVFLQFSTGADNCSAHEKCTRAKFKRMEFNPKCYQLQQKARDRLKTDEGWHLYRKRGAEVETVFGQVKGNWRFRRFNGWGKSNASCEWGLLMMAYNLKNIAIAPRK